MLSINDKCTVYMLPYQTMINTREAWQQNFAERTNEIV